MECPKCRNIHLKEKSSSFNSENGMWGTYDTPDSCGVGYSITTTIYTCPNCGFYKKEEIEEH